MATIEQERRRPVTFSMTAADEQQIRAIADGLYEGSLSMALRHLIAVHAGKELAKLEQDPELPDYEPPTWRKQRLSRELIARVCALVYAGNIHVHAYALAGVSSKQAAQWLAQGRADISAGRQSLHADFALGIDEAQARMVSEQVALAKKKGDYKFILARFPDYAKVTRSDSTVTHNVTPLIVWEQLTLAEARTLVALMRKASPSVDDPSVSRTARPAAELIPAEILEGEGLEFEESTDASDEESTSASDQVRALEAGPASAADVGQAAAGDVDSSPGAESADSPAD